MDPAAETDLRKYLALVVDSRIERSESAFEEAQRDIVDDKTQRNASKLPLFDLDFYLSQRGSRLARDMTPLRDYFSYGAQLKLSPHPLIDVSFVDRACVASIGRDGSRADSDNKDEFRNPLIEVLACTGGYCNPNSLFDSEIYISSLKRSGVIQSADSVQQPVLHYLDNWRTYYNDNKLCISSYFDPYFFSIIVSRNESALIDPLTHYFRHPVNERPDCNPRFHGGFYRATYNIGNADSLCHFLEMGAARGYLPNPYAGQELGIGDKVLPANLLSRLLIDYIESK